MSANECLKSSIFDSIREPHLEAPPNSKIMLEVD